MKFTLKRERKKEMEEKRKRKKKEMRGGGVERGRRGAVNSIHANQEKITFWNEKIMSRK